MSAFFHRFGAARKTMDSVNRAYSEIRRTEEYSIQKRFSVIMKLVLLSFIAITSIVMYKVVRINHQEADTLFAKVESHYRLKEVLPGLRGQILDRNGYLLAESLKAYGVWVQWEPFQKARIEHLELLSRLLDIPKSQLDAFQKKEGGRSHYLKRQVDYDVMVQLRDARIPGIQFELETKRFYLEGENTAHLTGFVDIDGKGREGIELMKNSILMPENGYQRVLRDRLGNVIGEVGSQHPPKAGQRVYLTIDKNIQASVMKALKEVVHEYKAEAASAIVVDVHTGEILSMANYPSYDPNKREKRVGDVLRNRVVTDVFEPGSIIKPLVMSLALDAKVVHPNTKIDVEHGYYTYQRKEIKDVSHRHTILTPAQIIKYSSNVGMVKISEMLSAEQMWTTFDRLQFGHRPENIFPGAVSGVLSPAKNWKPIEKATRAYGYGVSMSLFQVAQAYTALVRGGEMITLSLLKDETLTPPKKVQVYTPQSANRVLSMLEQALGNDDGSRLQDKVPYYRIGGKSGTARQSDGVRGYKDGLYNASFVMVGPISNPQVVIAVTVSRLNRNRGYYGGKVAAPVAAQIMNDTMRILSIRPDRDPEKIKVNQP